MRHSVSFNRLIFEVVDDVLKQVFGERPAEVIYDFMEKFSHLKREEIAEKPEVFSAVLGKLLGSTGRLIERLILKNLCSRLQLEYEEKEGYSFSDYIKELRERFER